MTTTYEMDGLFTQQDIDNRHKAYAQCLNCYNYSLYDTTKDNFKCDECGETKYNPQSAVSLRTYNPSVHNKKKKPKKK